MSAILPEEQARQLCQMFLLAEKLEAYFSANGYPKFTSRVVYTMKMCTWILRIGGWWKRDFKGTTLGQTKALALSFQETPKGV